MSIHPSLVPDCHDDESPASFCSRMARLSGRRARDFCLDFGMSFQKVVDGDPQEMRVLDRLCGLPGRRFVGMPIIGSGHAFEIAGQAFKRETLSRKVLRVCPSCVAGDLESGRGREEVRPYGRTIWLVGSLRTCPRHSRPLVVASTDDRPNMIHDFAGLLAPALSAVIASAPDDAPRSPSAFETYVLERIDGGSPEGWLAPFPLFAVCKIAETIGAVELFGRHFKTEALAEDDWYEAGAAGFEIANAGSSSVRSFLERLQTRFTASRTSWGPRSTFGRMYEWLAYECENQAFDPLRDLIRTHVLETMPVGPGDEIFGKPGGTRRLHSIRSASEQSGAHPKRFRKLAKAAGLIDDSSDRLTDDRILVEAGRMDIFLEGIAEALSLKEAGCYLGVPRPIDLYLLRSGIIQPWIAGARDSLGDHAFRRSDLDAFLARLLVRRGDVGSRSMYRIGRAARRANCSVIEIVQLILDGRLATVAIDPSELGFASVRVDVGEVLPLVRRAEHGGLSLREAETRLGTTNKCLKALVDKGYLASRRALNPINRCPQTVIDESILDEFQVHYVSLMMLARETGIHHLRLKKQLAARGVLPAFEDMPVTYYERRSLDP